MSRYVFKLPDLGEGIVSSEVVAWRVKPGDFIREDDPLVEMSTDKAVVEVPSPASGTVVTLGGKPGDVIAVGAELAVLETDANAAAKPAAAADKPAAAPAPAVEAKKAAPVAQASQQTESGRVMASPSTRRLAKTAGVDLQSVKGSGPGGRIRREDLEEMLKGGSKPAAAPAAAKAPLSAAEEIREEVQVIGVRRVIAQRMAEAKRTIPHFSYVEEVDVSELEALRVHLNKQNRDKNAQLTYLPFIIQALIRAIDDFPQVNARYDATRETVVRYRAVHVGIATQTPDGLKVPVMRNAQQLSIREMSREISRLSEAARTAKAKREELSGSTLTLTSLGKLGGIVTTPVVNMPEVSIVGVNRAVERPVVYGGQIAVRRMMNLSSSFDHRFVDGYDAAAFIQAVKALLEHPALLFASGDQF